jgi:hypothetical protein
MIALKQSSAIRRAHLPDLLAKKSRSTGFTRSVVKAPDKSVTLRYVTAQVSRETA